MRVSPPPSRATGVLGWRPVSAIILCSMVTNSQSSLPSSDVGSNYNRSFGGASMAPATIASSSQIMYSTSDFPNFLPAAGEEIDDARCTMDDLERANDMQLHVIFSELQQTNFFQHFVVDLNHKCPLSRWTPGGGATSSGGSGQKLGGGHTETASSPSDVDDDDDEGHCTGGEALGLDEDAEPLCSVDTGGDGNDGGTMMLFGGTFGGRSDGAASASTSIGDDGTIESNALQSLSQMGFSSQRQRDTFAWNQQTDIVVKGQDAPCEQHDGSDLEVASSLDLPDSFWMDICSNIHEGDGTKLVNLALNPERNTGYNGTHIWKAIYEENCITTDDSCLEERVLYKLLSGMHTSTTLSIAQNYYPPSKKRNRTEWEANPAYFMDKFQNHPDHIRNLHFSYVVLLRAIKKASEYLYKYEMKSGNVVEDETSHILLRRLLDTAILRSCSTVFTAFDESVMFNDDYERNNVLLQQSFKGVFHNISSILDCVQCQQCKLHGKLTMLGYGTALKILFVKSPSSLVLERNEVVALINTAARLSESLVQVRELTALYWQDQRNKLARQPKVIEATETAAPAFGTPPSYDSLDMVDITVGAIASLGRKEYISMDRETELISMALARHPELLILSKHYHTDPERFASMVGSLEIAGGIITGMGSMLPIRPPDAIVVGSGLAGLAASLNILDRGGTVVIIEKEHLLGGNSNKASSGINGCCPQNDTYNDSLEAFRNDTIRSAGELADLSLIEVLVSKSEQAVLWLKERANVDLSLLSQLGGHAHKRTHRPSNGMAGAEIIYHLQKEVRAFEKTGRVKILVDTRVTELLTEQQENGRDRVVGVRCESTKDGTVQETLADNVMLATGGFASDRSSGSYLDQHRPELMSFPATAGGFSTGDGITLATTLGAATRDMDKVQIHPTGWVDPKDPTNPSKVLAAELMRGVGGILINQSGERFCNELGTRAYVTNQMLNHDDEYASTGSWNRSKEVPTFFLVLSSSAAADGKKHVDLYTHKGLLTEVHGVDALSRHMNLDKKTLTRTLQSYQAAAVSGTDNFGKSSFRGVPADDLDNEVFFVGVVTPVLHYCMGGIKIDTEGSVIREDGTTIEGLHAAGEVSGGVHGKNRLGGNSLLECTVFGTIVGQKLPLKQGGTYRIAIGDGKDKGPPVTTEAAAKPAQLPKLTIDELAGHKTKDDIWVAIHGFVYDFTEFAHEHPGGFESIFELAGKDGSDAFDAVHNLGMLEDFEDDKRGILL
jgi:flavocytochrome c